MAGALLDTSAVLEGLGGLRLPESAAISVITLGELRAGVLLARDDETGERREAGLAAARAAFRALTVDAQVAERYGDVLAVARAQGRVAKATDLLIIATASVHDRTLYTLDVRQSRLAVAAGVAVAAE